MELRTTTAAALLTAGTLAFAGPAMAAPVTIDTFDKDQGHSLAGNATGTTGSEVDDSNTGDPENNPGTILGGYRDMQLDTTAGSSNKFLDVNADASGTPGEYGHSQGDDVTGVSTLQWDGNDGDIANVDEDGLTSTDLTDNGNNNAIKMGIILSDLAADVSFNVFSGIGNSSSLTQSTAGGIAASDPTVDFFFNFSDFTTTSGTGADFGNVTAIEMVVDGSKQATDLRLDFVEANNNPIPEPASLAALGLGGLMLIPRRRRA